MPRDTASRDTPIRAYAIHMTCLRCEDTETFYVTDGYHRWLGGLPARHVFLTMPRADARFIDTGICPACHDDEEVR